MIPELWRDRTSIQAEGLREWWPDSALMLNALLVSGLDKILPHAYRQCRDSDHFQYYLWGWFDAFKTLKFVHYLRDQVFPNLSLLEAVADLPVSFESIPEGVSPTSLALSHLHAIKTKLMILENQLPVITNKRVR